MAPPPAQLVDDLVEEVLLRFPPKDPAALVRAALVCKRWRRLVSSPAFRRRFGEFHRRPPMLGMFCDTGFIAGPHFVPTTAFRPHYAERSHMRALDARHGRVLLWEGTVLGVWNTITKEEWNMPFPPRCKDVASWAAAVLCSAAGGSCDRLDCHRGPFTVVLAASHSEGPDAVLQVSIYTYSSNADAWSEPTCCQQPQPGYFVNSWKRSALVGSTLYFADMLKSSTALKYNMQSRQISWIQLPSSVPLRAVSALAATEDGGLQFAIELRRKLYIWSTKDADGLDTRWEQNRVIELNTLLPGDANLTRLVVVGSMDDLGTIFVSLDDASYAIDLETNKAKKVCEGATITIVPYVTFYTPVALEAREGPTVSAGGSSA